MVTERILDCKYAVIDDTLVVQEDIRLVFNGSKLVASEQIRSGNHIVIPGFVNAHVHTADIGLRGNAQGSLSELVGPGGLKQRHISGMRKHELLKSISTSLQEGIQHGIHFINDFREGGIEGIQPYLEDLSTHLNYNQLPVVNVLGRPRNTSDVEGFPGIGIRDVVAYDINELVNIAKEAKRLKKPFQMHAGEDPILTQKWLSDYDQTDVGWVLTELEPDVVVHSNHAAPDDYAYAARKNIGIVLCPSSNIITGTQLHDYKTLTQFPVDLLAIGTDNAMFNKLDMISEMRVLEKLAGFTKMELFRMATFSGHKISKFNHITYQKVFGLNTTPRKFMDDLLRQSVSFSRIS